jgi:hypothetical protein
VVIEISQHGSPSIAGAISINNRSGGAELDEPNGEKGGQWFHAVGSRVNGAKIGGENRNRKVRL